MDTQALYVELLEEIAADQIALDKGKEALDEKKELVRLLKKRLDASSEPLAFNPPGVLSPPRAIARPEGGWPFPKGDGAGPDQQPQPIGVKTAQPTIAQLVTSAVRFLAGREFVVGDVIPAMRSAGMRLPDNLGNAQVTTVLKRLHATGALERTYIGGGNVPHKYRVAEPKGSTAAKPDPDNRQGALLATEGSAA